MDRNELQRAKAEDLIPDSLDPVSNISMDRLEQSAKQFSPRISTLDGMHMDNSELHSLKTSEPICDR
jgi:hypothetical protein